MGKSLCEGRVLAVEVAPGHDVLLRVVAKHGASRCVVMTRQTGTSLLSPALFRVQPRTHHHWNRPMLGGWVHELPPPEVRWLGKVALRKAEKSRVLHPELWVKAQDKSPALSVRVLPVCTWSQLLGDVRAQWRWENEPDAVLAEDAGREQASASRLEAAFAAHARRVDALKKQGVAALRGELFFEVWQRTHPVALIHDAEEAMQHAVAELLGKSPAQASKRLLALARTFHKIGERHGHQFDATDREDIMDAVGKLAVACGVSAPSL